MQSYPVRATRRRELTPETIERLAQEHFESATRQGDTVRTAYGALAALAVRADGKALEVDVTMNPKVPEDVARETIRRYNNFLEAATGFTAKERAKRLQKAAKEHDAGS
ncbi:MAG TPA: DUF5611 family protein [Thermoplasmata archaeon]|nr:DUF5611 family protein [Thermoplasmata archaeon]